MGIKLKIDKYMGNSLKDIDIKILSAEILQTMHWKKLD